MFLNWGGIGQKKAQYTNFQVVQLQICGPLFMTKIVCMTSED